MDEDIESRKINNSFLRDHNYATEGIRLSIPSAGALPYEWKFERWFGSNRERKYVFQFVQKDLNLLMGILFLEGQMQECVSDAGSSLWCA